MRFRVFTILIATLIHLSTSFDLKCESVTAKWEYEGTISYCQVKSLNITSPNGTITSVNGSTAQTTFQGLDIQNVVVHYLPKGIGKFFPQLIMLNIVSTGLKSIQAADLEGLSNLESLYIHFNDIEELSSDLFKFTPKISVLYLSENQISRIGKDLLTNFHSFKRIEFSGNKCIDTHETRDFEGLKNELQTKCPYVI